MDRNPFSSVNERRNKLATDRNGAHQIQHLQQPFQPPMLRANMQPVGNPSRGLTSSNWRTGDEGARGNDMMAFDASIGQHARNASNVRQPTFLLPVMDPYQQQSPTSYPSSPSTVSDMQLEACYAYCYDRGNGQYTRLVPADMLPPLKDIPAVQQSCSGMMVLPQPRAIPSEGRSSNAEPIILRGPPDSPSSPSDSIQSRIDTIVASTPPTPTHLQAPMSPVGVVGLGLGPGSTVTSAPGSHHHHHHHNSHSHSHSHHRGGGGGGNHGGGGGGGSGGGSHANNGNQQQQQQQQQQPQRRPKIYCDKWVHEGVCAFTQQGCKYKHEMPFDKVTQHQLGLFHGFPAWWKKHQADLSRQRDSPVVGGGGNAGVAGAEEPARLSGDRFLGRPGSGPGPGTTAGPSNAAAAPASGGAGNGEPGDMGPGSAGQDLPTWRRSVNGNHVVGSRNMPARVGPNMRAPIVSYGSPFGPIAPPVRTSPLTPGTYAANMGDAGHAGSPHQQQTGEAGKSGRPGAGVPTDNPYASLETLSLENGNGNGNLDGRAGVATNGSNGARLT
ncbi:hypothetical protein Hte_010169 [Hypoxylon texense]